MCRRVSTMADQSMSDSAEWAQWGARHGKAGIVWTMVPMGGKSVMEGAPSWEVMLDR